MAVELESFPVDQAIRNFHAVFGCGKEAFRLVTAHIDGRLWRYAGVGDFASGIDRPNAGGREPAGEKDERAIFIRGREYVADRAIKWQRDVTDMPIPIHPAQSVDATIHHFEIETVLRPLDLIDDQRPLRHDSVALAISGLAVLVLSNRPRGVPLLISR